MALAGNMPPEQTRTVAAAAEISAAPTSRRLRRRPVLVLVVAPVEGVRPEVMRDMVLLFAERLVFVLLLFPRPFFCRDHPIYLIL